MIKKEKKNFRKMFKVTEYEALRLYPYQITSTPAAYYPRLQDLVPNNSWDTGMRPYEYMYLYLIICIWKI